ncbi:MAG: phosphotransferase enzyme family protein [Spirochaetota bacterium]
MQIEPARNALDAFPVTGGEPWRLAPFGIGRIHETFSVSRAADRSAGREPVFLLQSVNLNVFPDYEALMHNVDLVSRYLDSPLRFEHSREGKPYFESPEGGVWRLMRFVPQSVPVPVPSSVGEAGEAARAFGEFAASLASLDASRVEPVIPGFHDTPARVRVLREAAGESPPSQAATLLEWVAEREVELGMISARLASGAFPPRVCHNDAKADNVLVHRESGRRLCVIDLDTVMPGSPLFDLGDLLRSSAATVGEDDPEIGSVDVRWESAEAILEGFLEAAGSILTDEELRLARGAGWLLASEQAIRYLSDHLSGSRYYRSDYPGQNLDRARNQFALAAAFERGGWAFTCL